MKVIYSIKSMKYMKRQIVIYHIVYYMLMILLILVAFFTMVRSEALIKKHKVIRSPFNFLVLGYFRFTQRNRCVLDKAVRIFMRFYLC